MSIKHKDTKLHNFIEAYVKSQKGQLTDQTDEVFTIKYPNHTGETKYTYEPAVARQQKAILLTPGSIMFQQILDECLGGGVLCQINLELKGELENLLKSHFKDSPFTCQDCTKITTEKEEISICEKPQLCHHQINNGKIVSTKTTKKEPLKYFLFYFSATFRNKLRPKNEELIPLLIDECGKIVCAENFSEKNFLTHEFLEFQDFKGKLKPEVFDELKAVADKELDVILREKLLLFDLPLAKDKESKLKSFDKRLRRERLEQAIYNKNDLDSQKWQIRHETLLKREEESLTTNIAVKFINLLVINTAKLSFELTLDNNATVHSSIILGINHTPTVTCPICRTTFFEGYATQDAFYVCKNCIKQSVDTKKIYSKKAPLKLDETLNEYFEPDAGFVCSVCGKKHSHLLEFKCSHDNSSICIFHYDYCDFCGKIFSKLNLTSTHEFKRKLCPKHVTKCETCQSIFGVDEIKVSNSGKKMCGYCIDKSREH